MIVSDANASVVCLTSEEIELIIEGLSISYHEWNDMKAGALMTQFHSLKASVDSERNQVLDDQE